VQNNVCRVSDQINRCVGCNKVILRQSDPEGNLPTGLFAVPPGLLFFCG